MERVVGVKAVLMKTVARAAKVVAGEAVGWAGEMGLWRKVDCEIGSEAAHGPLTRGCPTQTSHPTGWVR